jgi:hypothetical protein
MHDLYQDAQGPSVRFSTSEITRNKEFQSSRDQMWFKQPFFYTFLNQCGLACRIDVIEIGNFVGLRLYNAADLPPMTLRNPFPTKHCEILSHTWGNRSNWHPTQKKIVPVSVYELFRVKRLHFLVI